MSRLQTRVFYGLRTDVLGNAHYVSDDEVLYLVGNALALHNFSQRRQRLVRLPDKHTVSLMTIAPNRKYAALCESGEKPLISLYDLGTLKRRKLLGVPQEFGGSRSFSCVGFSFDARYLTAVTDEGQTMLVYSWERGKVESSLELLAGAQSPGAKVQLLACNPSDVGIVAVAGPHTLKLLSASETLWRPYGFGKAEGLHVTSLAWLNGDRLLAGTSDGRILYLENGDLKNIFRAPELELLNLKLREEVPLHPADNQQQQQQSSLQLQPQSQEVLGLTAFQRGFAFALGLGSIFVFEKDGPHKYVSRGRFDLPEQSGRHPGLGPELARVNSISANPSADRLLVTCGWSQLFCASLWGSESEVLEAAAVEQAEEEQQLDDNDEEAKKKKREAATAAAEEGKLQTDQQQLKSRRQLEVLGHRLHHGPIGGLSGCAWKPQVITYGELDRSVRLWDYEAESLVMLKQYLERISCVVLHPTGLFCLIGFSDKLRFMSILIDDFLPIKEFPIRSCKIAAFGFGGHLFAAVNGNIIQVYSTLDFNIRFLLKGHTEIICGITWSHDDRKLVSIGTEGAVYEWDMSTGSRVKEVVLKDIALMGVVLSADDVTAYCMSGDGYIHEIKESRVIHAYNIPNVEPRSIVMSKDDSLIYITYGNGFIACLKYPLQNPVEYHEHHIHCSEVTQMYLTQDENALISAGSDGSMCFWKISYRAGRDSTVARAPLRLEQILIGRSNLAAQLEATRELGARARELETEHAYRMRQTALRHNEAMRDLHQAYCAAIEELRDKIDRLEDERANEINAINVEISRNRQAREEELRRTEVAYDAKLIVEYDKYARLEEHCNAMRGDFESKLKELEERDRRELEDVVAKYEDKMREKELQLRDAHEEMSQEVRMHEMMKEQMEDDADREIVELRGNYESLLNEERQVVLKLKGEAGVLRNKYAMSQKDLEELRSQMNGLRDEYAQLKARKEELDEAVTDLKTEVADKGALVLAREQRIAELELSIQELQKNKFVLEHRVTEMLGQIEPRDLEIRELKAKIADMELELLALGKHGQSRELKLTELRERLAAARREAALETRERKRVQQLLRRVRIELLEAAALVQEPAALKAAIIRLYNRHSASEQLRRGYQADLDAQCEFAKQRGHLERTIGLLKKQLVQAVGAAGDLHYDKLLDDNVLLLSELNALREDLAGSHRRLADMESLLLGVKDRQLGPTEARAKLKEILYGNEELKRNYEKQLDECRNFVEVLKESIAQLHSKILKRDADD